jgi:hypothetical protein
VVVFDGDTPEDLAASFCHQFSLGPSMQAKLLQMLTIEMSGLLGKIVEEDTDEQNESDNF